MLNLKSGARRALLICTILLWGITSVGGAEQKTKPATRKDSAGGWQMWKSETTKKVYRVKIDQDHFVAELANVPAEAKKQGAYIRSECRRAGNKWVGTTRALLPCALPGAEKKTRTCELTLRIEVDSISPARIEGAGDSLHNFDCSKCQVLETGWAKFTWVPEGKAK